MIRHMVLFKLNDGVSKDEPRVLAGAKAFEELDDHIDLLREWECGWNVTDRDIAYDFALSGLLDDEDALQAYLVHPAHVAGVAPWRDFASWIAADIEVPGPAA